MAKQPKLNDSIHQFNQDILGRELTAALIIKNQLRALTDDLLKTEAITQESQEKILASADKTIKDMLDAESKEIFILHRTKFVQLLLNLKEKFSLQGDLDKALKDYRAFLEIQRIIHDMTTTKNQGNLAKWFLDNAEYEVWKEKLNQLKQSDDFELYKSELMAELVLLQSQENLANLAAMSRINQYDRILSDTRLSYLREAASNRKILIDLALIVIGILLGAAGAILGFVFPALVIPGLIIGAIAFTHGAIDFVKINGFLLSKFSSEDLGDRSISPETKAKILHKFPDFKEDEFLTYQDVRKQAWVTERNWHRGLGYAIAVAAFIFAIAGLIVALPGLGIPMAAIIAITVIGFAITVLALVVWGHKVARDKEKTNEIQQEVDAQMIADKTLINDSLGIHKEDQLSSSAKILLNNKRLIEEEEQKLNSIGIVKLDPELFKEKPVSSYEEKEPGREKDKDDDDEGEGEGKTPSKKMF